MPGILVFASGAVVLVFLAVDAAWTTLWPDRGGGPASSRLAVSAGRFVTSARGGHHTVRSLLGPLIVILLLLLWVVLLISGWFLVFSADETSVVDATTRQRASALERLYYVGYTVFTLGNGDFRPNGDWWRLATTLATASGLVLITVAITYLISLLGAVVNMRTFAARVHAIGESPADFVTNAWDGSTFSGVDLLLSSLAADLTRLSTQHRAYPVIHFYHPTARHESTAVAVATLDEAVTLFGSGVKAPARPSRVILRSVRGSVEGYLSTLEGGAVSWADADLPLPDLATLRAAEIPTVADEDYQATRDSARDRRRKLRGLIESDGRSLAGR